VSSSSVGRRRRSFQRSKRASTAGDVDRVHGGHVPDGGGDVAEDVDERRSDHGVLLRRSVTLVDAEEDRRTTAERGLGRLAPLFGRPVGPSGSVVTRQQQVPSTPGDFQSCRGISFSPPTAALVDLVKQSVGCVCHCVRTITFDLGDSRCLACDSS